MEVRTENIQFKVTKAEKEKIKKLGEILGLPYGTECRLLVLEKAQEMGIK